MPHKSWVAGELVTAADMNTYLQEQAVSTHASAVARAAAIPVPAGGQVSWLDDEARLEVYAGAQWVAYTPNRTGSTSVTAAQPGPVGTGTAGYSHIGDQLTAEFTITMNAGGASGNFILDLTGLPEPVVAGGVIGVYRLFVAGDTNWTGTVENSGAQPRQGLLYRDGVGAALGSGSIPSYVASVSDAVFAQLTYRTARP